VSTADQQTRDLVEAPRMRSIAIVGMSLAGLRAAETLRRAGFDGRITAIGAEDHLPYDRPPLSKELLAGKWNADDVVLRKQGVDDLALDWRLGRRAVALDLADRRIALDDESAVDFDGLVIATGSEPRRLPPAAFPGGNADLDGAFVLRTLGDAMAIRDRLDARPRVVVIGAGFIGAEVAATCRGRWCGGSGRRSVACAPTCIAITASTCGSGSVSKRSKATAASNGCGSPTGRASTPTCSSWGSAWCPRPTGSLGAG
jgi:hypothetical protein